MMVYSPDIVAGMIRAAYAEGVLYGSQHPTNLGDGWDNSKARREAATLMRVQSDPTVAEKALSILRLWANMSPEGTTPEEAWKRASKLMRQLRELIGDPPLDAQPGARP